MILDIDRFKGVNDGYGRPAGDEALRRVAARLRAAVRSGDTLARLVGAEFAVLAPRRAPRRSATWASACRLAVGGEPFAIGADTLRLTASVGGACYPDDARDSTELVQIADRALYEAKRQGRDRVGPGAGVPTLPMPSSSETRDVAAVVADHHERPDGRGYPAGKAGDEIPIEARIASTLDAWTAMLVDGACRERRSPADAADELRRGRGTQFDPRVVDALLLIVRADLEPRAA